MSSTETEEYSNAFPSDWKTIQQNTPSKTPSHLPNTERKTVTDQTSLEREGITIRDFADCSQPQGQMSRIFPEPDCDDSKEIQTSHRVDRFIATVPDPD